MTTEDNGAGEADYAALCDRVEKVDAEAAAYMRGFDARLLPRFTPYRCLSWCFTWADTPHGHRYWEKINTELAR